MNDVHPGVPVAIKLEIDPLAQVHTTLPTTGRIGWDTRDTNFDTSISATKGTNADR
jgi:hypothetical protein